MKKKLSLIAVAMLLATQVPTPAHADAVYANTTTATKVATAKLSGDYWYDLSIVDGRLVAKGDIERVVSTDPHDPNYIGKYT